MRDESPKAKKGGFFSKVMGAIGLGGVKKEKKKK